MALSDINIRYTYNKASDDIAADFYSPCMRNATRYDRISGYFGSTIYLIAWSALKEFIANGGQMRIICSPFLPDSDAEAIKEGTLACEQPALYGDLFKEFNEIFEKENLSTPHRLLACLIATNILEVKVAVAEQDPNRLFHDKAGIFSDSNGAVAFRGSINETFKGLSNDGNFESLDAFTSWWAESDISRLNDIRTYFDKLWNNEIDVVTTYSLPSKLIDTIRTHYKNTPNWGTLIDEVEASISIAKQWSADKSNGGKTPRTHQVDALEKWKANNYKGIFEHATGSGKTFTAICAIRKHIERDLPVLVLVPSVGLLEQWQREIDALISDLEPLYLLCGDGHNSWKHDNRLSIMTNPHLKAKRTTIAVMDTAATDEFIKGIYQSPQLLLIADEVHRLGSTSRSRFIERVDAGYRLGLSATPKRYGDLTGTAKLINYFNKIIQPPYTLYDAINDKVLTPYFYYPNVVSLTENEQQDWDDLSNQIRQAFARMSDDDRANAMNNSRVKNLLIRRARILKKARNKVSLAISIIKENYQSGQRWIIYCEDSTQLTEVSTALRNAGYDNIVFHSNMAGDRNTALGYFENIGGIIVSIRCLDEGIDIPATSHALILASSQNPREFVQRRGRVLRKHTSKNFSYLYDAIVVPNNFNDALSHDSIVAGELSRAIQFGMWSKDKTCITKLKLIALDNKIEYESLTTNGIDTDE